MDLVWKVGYRVRCRGASLKPQTGSDCAGPRLRSLNLEVDRRATEGFKQEREDHSWSLISSLIAMNQMLSLESLETRASRFPSGHAFVNTVPILFRKQTMNIYTRCMYIMYSLEHK